MATQRFPHHGAHGHFQDQYNFHTAYDQEPVDLPMRSNAGLIAGLALTLGSIVALFVYYVL